VIAITAELLQAAVGCTRERAAVFAEHLDASCRHYGIDTPARLAAYLAQIGHESGSFRWVREIADGSAYEGRRDLGNTQPGDGPRYRGRGLIQITGRGNYREMAQRLASAGAPDFEQQPEALEDPQWAAWSAACWWDSRNLNALADAGEFDRITRVINGGTNGAAERRQRWERAKAALATHVPPTPEKPPTASPAAAAGPSMPPGEAPDWVPPAPKESTMPAIAPIIAAVLPSIVEAIPKLGKVFGSGSQVAERNIKAAELVVETVTAATGAVNAQDAAERLRADPAAAQAATQAIDAIWYELTEAGSGGIDGARKADAAAQAGGSIRKSPSFWIALALLPLVYLLVLSLIGLIGSATWSDDVRAGLAGSLISAIVGGLVGYYYGTTTSRNRASSP
jgi:putative chitinase